MMLEEKKDSLNKLQRSVDRVENKINEIASFRDAGGFSLMKEECGRGEGEIDLRSLWDVIWHGRWIIAIFTFLFVISAAVVAYSLPNVYRSQVLLAPVENGSPEGMGALVGSLGGLATLAGVKLGGETGNKTVLALEILKSRSFLSHVIQKHDLLVALMATSGWDVSASRLVIDPDVYDLETNQWVRKAPPPREAKPSNQEAYEVFIKKMILGQDKQTGFVSLSVDFFSPIIAKQWVDILVSEVNDAVKAREVAEAERSIEYLRKQIEKTPIADMQAVFYELIEEQTKIIMFAEVRDEYVFKTIDAALVPERPIRPKRVVICVIGLLVGLILSTLFVLFRHAIIMSSVSTRRD